MNRASQTSPAAFLVGTAAVAVLTVIGATGLFRVLPGAVPTLVPLVLIMISGAGLALHASIPKFVPLGMMIGAGAQMAFLYWLFTSWG